MGVWQYGGMGYGSMGGPTNVVREEVVFDDGRSVRSGAEEGRLGGGGGACGLGGRGGRGDTRSLDLL